MIKCRSFQPRDIWAIFKSNIANAREIASILRKEIAALLGEEHKEFLNSTEILAKAYLYQGRWEDAKQLEV